MTPDNLMIDPCSPVTAGDTVRSLAKGYVQNTSCIGQYRLLLEKQRKHKLSLEQIYDNGK